jgi:glycine hydroxymethyltransferase
LAREHKPKLVIAGASAYSREIEFAKFAEVCREVSALLMVDMAHIAGLVAAKRHADPVPYAEFVTSTTHKTLRGPRGGFILSKNDWGKKVDSAVFPGVQGGPLMHVIAAKAVAFGEALQPAYRQYIDQVIRNAQTLANELARLGFRIVSGGTDNHLFMADVFSKGITGKDGQNMLEAAGITVNKNTIPFDQNKPMVASGVRIGTPAVTTRGLAEPEMKTVAELIARVLDSKGDADVIATVKSEVKKLCDRFPIY